MRGSAHGHRVAILSMDYVPQDTPTDKQFVHEYLGILSKRIEFAVWSLSDQEETHKQYRVGKGKVLFHSRNRVFHKHTFSHGVGTYQAHPIHSSLRAGVEINLSMIYYLRDVRSFMAAFKPDLIHFTDSAGPVAGLVKRSFPNIPMSITKPTMQIDRDGWSGKLYKYYVKKSMIAADKVISFTNAGADELKVIGVPRERVKIIPWGIPIPQIIPEKNTSSIKKRYGCGNGELLVVVTDRTRGYLNETVDYLKTLAKTGKFKFIVAVKPTLFKPEYNVWTDENVFLEDGPDDYHDLLTAADVMYSPLGNFDLNRASLLPLTWMEAMLRRTPVITLNAPGVNDLINDNENGFLYRSRDELPAILNRLIDNDAPEQLGNLARQTILDRFDISFLAQKYADIWCELISKSK